MTRTDDFPNAVKAKLASRVGHHCSNPDCRRTTSGPGSENTAATINIGVAAHITAAAPGGPRFDQAMTSAMRSSIDNAIWCCQTCAKLIDSDENKYTVAVLSHWKASSEANSMADISSRIPAELIAADPYILAAQTDILVGALEGHAGNMIVFGEDNGWDTVNLVGEKYCTNEDERLLYVEAMMQLISDGFARRRGTGVAYELTYSGRERAKKLVAAGASRRKPGKTSGS